MVLDKLEYVEIHYNFLDNGSAIVCHYASGKTIVHLYSWESTKKYMRHATKHHCVSYAFIPRDMLDNMGCTLLSFNHIWQSQYV